MSATLHQKIQSDLEKKICSGRWPPGHRIPFEHELMETYDCSRMTVSKVLTALAKRGLIRRQRRVGSFVEAPTHHAAILDIPDIQSDIQSRNLAYRFKLLSRKERVPQSASEIELAAGGRLLELRCVHFENEAPFALEERLISIAAVPAASDIDFSRIAPGTWLLSHVPWNEAQHTITAISATAKLARALRIPANAACLSLERRTWKRGQPITDVRQIFPGERLSLTARFRPSES